jgi:trehalose-6-phosphate synthase
VTKEGTGRRGSAELVPALQQAFPDRPFFVVSNREPYEHHWDDGHAEVVVRRPAGGLTSALDPLMQAVGGVWIAWGSGDADREVVDDDMRVRVPPESPAYTLHRVWLDQQDVHQYYFGYANQFLWPLCHLRPALTRIRRRYWERYQSVNRRFAETAAAEAAAVSAERGGAQPVVWFQDYHLATAPARLRALRPEASIAHFWHIPFPPIEIFRIASDGRALLEGLAANDLLGFHLPLFCDNFLRCAESLLTGARVDWDRRAVVVNGRPCYVRAFPISIDIEAFAAAGRVAGADTQIARLRARYAPRGGQLGIGVDRIDYSKGLEEKLKALELLWEENPNFRERFSYVQVAVPSRTGIEAYDWLNEKIERMVWGINDRYGTGEWRPVHLLKESLPAERLALLYRAADVCVIASLQDGMNLVAKEFIASQAEGGAGVLVLSKFAGAAEELEGQLEVNPFDPEGFAGTVRDALLMPDAERRERLARMRAPMRSIYDWMAETFEVWGAVARGEPAPLSEADRWARLR